jgi:exopolyphosphatase/guanosine-5'-triphosphate,3'-diphosphate pyrophosphatase
VSPHRTRRIAAIDIGTVTTRLLVADVGDDAVHEVFRSTDITHLGEGLTAAGRLDSAAMERVANSIDAYVARIREYGVEHVTAYATSASRDAENGDEFRKLLAARGVEPEIISGAAEARLAFAGATFELEGEGILVADLGGGSTELVLGSVGRNASERIEDVESSRSIDVGSKRVTELFLHSDPPTPLELEEARAFATHELRPYFDGLRSRPRMMVALAGTATTLSAIQQGLVTYEPERVHKSCLTGSDLADLLEQLSSLPLEERVRVTGLDPGRAPVIVAGTLILETVVGLAGLDSTLVSEHDILYGILLESYRHLV